MQRLKTKVHVLIFGDRRCNNYSRLFLSSWYILSLLQDSSFDDRCDGYLTLAEYVQDFLNHLTEQPGCFETEIEQFAETLNGWVIADEALQELVELIYQQVVYSVLQDGHYPSVTHCPRQASQYLFYSCINAIFKRFDILSFQTEIYREGFCSLNLRFCSLRFGMPELYTFSQFALFPLLCVCVSWVTYYS